MTHPNPPAPPLAPRLLMLACLAVAALIVVELSGFGRFAVLRDELDGWQAAVATHPVRAAVVFVGIGVALTSLPIPATAALTTVAGALFGRWWGGLLGSVAAAAGNTIACVGCRRWLRDATLARLGPRGRALLARVEREGAVALFALRVTPVVPAFLITLATSVTRVPVRTFAAVTWLGLLPAAFLHAHVGTELASARTAGELVAPSRVAALALLAVAPIVVRFVTRRAGVPSETGR